jgi:hypothetical protein
VIGSERDTAIDVRVCRPLKRGVAEVWEQALVRLPVPAQWDNSEMIRNRARKQWAKWAWVVRAPVEVLVVEEAWALVVESPERKLALELLQ